MPVLRGNGLGVEETDSYSFIHLTVIYWAPTMYQAHARCWGNWHRGGGYWRHKPTNERGIINYILCSLKEKQWGLFSDNRGALIWCLGPGVFKESSCVKYITVCSTSLRWDVHLKLHECSARARVCTCVRTYTQWRGTQGLPQPSPRQSAPPPPSTRTPAPTD